jgi:hypothetical protein
MNDIIDISSENWEPSTPKKVNFGGGIELLMNNSDKKSGGGSVKNDIDIEDLTNLEEELNNLTETSNTGEFSEPLFAKLASSSSSSSLNGGDRSVKFNEKVNISLGQSTAENANETKTWDGFGKFNNIPMNPDIVDPPPSQKYSKEEELREKFKFLRKLEALEKKGVDLTKKYSMESSLAEMQGEYEMIMEEKSRQNSVKFQGNMMMAVINGIEFLNNRFDPFDLKLEGWGEQLNENITDYDEIFGELHDKYKSKASMAPELKLLFQLGGSAMMVHMTNTMFKSSMPGMDDILRQNPDLMNQFQKAAVSSMSNTNPGFAGFMGGLMNEPPPPPVATQNANNSFQRQGNNNFDTRNIQLGRNNFSENDGINIKESVPVTSKRPEMKGPSDISDILSGLKTKTINIQETHEDTNNNSTISISDLKELQDSNLPKRSRRRNKSDKNTISLDI